MKKVQSSCAKWFQVKKASSSDEPKTSCFADAVHVGPAWLQQHSCEFITDVNLRQNGGGHTRAKTGEKSDLFRLMPGQGRARENIYVTTSTLHAR